MGSKNRVPPTFPAAPAPPGSAHTPSSSPSLPRIERSTDQVIKPVNLEALSKWTGHIPGDVLRDMAQIAPMLARLGYDPYANPPNYGNPDPIVINNTHRVSALPTGRCGRGWGLLLPEKTLSPLIPKQLACVCLCMTACIPIFAWASRKLTLRSVSCRAVCMLISPSFSARP